jgi:hypothetical protein
VKFKSIILALTMMGTASAQDLSVSETSYTGATILEGDWDVSFNGFEPISDSEDTFPYAFFEGNTLYAGNSDVYDNTIDAIVEFFWFQSSIDRGTDFYVAVIKTRVTPGHDCYYAPWDWARGAQCKLWADEWSDWGEYPVLSVEALTDVGREQGAFRWDWSIPFESYGIDAYGQVTFQNAYGIGSDSEGAVMAHGEYPINEDGDIKAEGNVQVKGYHSSEYSVQTQYEVTLYEWDVFVDGRADLMAWDMYLNLGARETQSAYHEYFLSIQVEEGQTFMLDSFNLIGNFDTGWYDPFHHELGITIENMTIGQPYWDPAEEEIGEDDEIDVDTPEENDGEEEADTGSTSGKDDNMITDFVEKDTNKEHGGCSTITTSSRWMFLMGIIAACFRRRD